MRRNITVSNHKNINIHPAPFLRGLGVSFIVVLLTGLHVFAQGFNVVDRMFFQNPTEEIYMKTGSVLADPDRFFTGGTNLVKLDGNSLTFQSRISCYDVNGNKLFQKNIVIDSCERNISATSANLLKIRDHKYAIAGSAVNLHKNIANGGVNEPFITYFDTAGTITKTFVLRDPAITRDLTGLTQNNKGEILGIGEQALTSGFFDPNANGGAWGGAFITDSTFFWLIKLDSSGQLLWHHRYQHLASFQWGAIATKLAMNPAQTEYLIVGTLNYGYPYMLKTDSAGNELWYKPLPLRQSYEAHPDLESPSDVYAFDIAAAPGGGYYFIASNPYWETYNTDTGTYTASNLAFYYGKLDEQGDTLWTREYRPNAPYQANIGRQIRVASNGDLIISGNIKVINATYQIIEDRTCLFRTDSLGNVKWYREPQHYTMEQNHGMNIFHQLYSLSLTPDHDGILAGGDYIGFYDPAIDSNAFNINTYSWLILLDSLGRRCQQDTVINVPNPCGTVLTYPTSISPIPDNTVFELFPNPATDKVTIKLQGVDALLAGRKLQLRIIDIKGGVIDTRPIKDATTTVHLDGLSKSIYIFELWNEDRKVKLWKVVKL